MPSLKAQSVLNAYNAGSATIVGRSSSGFPLVRLNSITGYHVNFRYGIEGQPTNVFMIKGTKSPSVVPVSPSKGD